MAAEPPPSSDNDDEPLREHAAAMIVGLSVHTLRRARCDRPDLNVPPHEKIGGKVFYGERIVRDFAVTRSLGRRKL